MGTDIKIDLDKVTKLNIGCGLTHYDTNDGWCNIDIAPECGADIVHDISTGLPMFKDSSIDTVVANGVLEMVESNKDFVHVMNEIWRVLKPDGILDGQVPSTDYSVFGQDPFDRRFFKTSTFEYFTFGEPMYHNYGKQYGFKPWKTLKCELIGTGIIFFNLQPWKK